MKRPVLSLACLLVLSTLLMPGVGLATEAKTTKATPATTAATQTGALIVYPEPPPDLTAEEAKAATEFTKPGDLPNLLVALGSMGAIFAIIVWGIVANRKASRSAAA